MASKIDLKKSSKLVKRPHTNPAQDNKQFIILNK